MDQADQGKDMKCELGFIGAGNMAEAIARAAIDKQIVAADRMVVFDPVEQRREVFAALGIQAVDSNEQVISQSSSILLAIKPQTLKSIGRDLQTIDVEAQIIVSIMAGITTAKIESVMEKPARLVRVMPNTPLMVGCGMAAVALGRGAKKGDETLSMRLFGAAGEAIFVDESELDAITAVSGSGPAYVFYLAEAMEKAAADLGLAPHARVLVGQTILGAAMLIQQSQDSTRALRQKVTSPGGTTEAAIQHIDANSTADVFVNAIKAAEMRSRELGA